MVPVLDPNFWFHLLSISVLNLLLSGDNALVIALAVRTLPRRQRALGQLWGALGAVVLRLVGVAVVGMLLQVALLQLLGGLLLVWIAIRLVNPSDGSTGDVKHGTSLGHAIWIIIVADVTMSLDNVLAIAAAARGDLFLVMFGIGLSLPIVVWGAALLARLMNRYVWIVWIGAGFLGHVAAEMALDDSVVRGVFGDMMTVAHRVVPVAVGVAIAAFGWRASSRKHAPAVETP
jgi:YjbE family integral membrane protein